MATTHRGLTQAAAILMLGFVGSRALGVVRNIALSSAFGTSPELDAYFAAFRIPDAVFQLLAGAALGSAFIPTFTGYMVQGKERDAWKIASSALNLAIGASLLASILLFLLSPWIVPMMVPGFSPENQSLTVQLTRLMLASSVFFCASGMVTGILNARHRFLTPALAPLMYNGCIILGTIWLSEPLGVMGPALGAVAGAALHLLVQLAELPRSKMVYRLTVDLTHPGVREVGKLMLPRVGSLGAMQVNWLVTTVLASTLSPGSLGALTYAWSLAMMPLGVFGMAISTAAFPTMAEQAAAEEGVALRRTLVGTLRLVLFLTIPASAGIILLREPLVATLFERGLFTDQSTQATAWALLFYSLGLVAHSAQEVLSRGFYSYRDTVTPLLFSLMAMVLNLAFSLVLMGPLGHGGLALAVSLAAALESTGLIILLSRRLGGLEIGELMSSVAKTCAATAVMAVVLTLLIGSYDVPLGQLLAGTSVGAIVFIAASWALGSEEVRLLARQIRHIGSRTK